MNAPIPNLNLYGDRPEFLVAGRGADIASQRADDLDEMALSRAREKKSAFALDIACGAGGQTFRLALQGATVVATDRADMGRIIQSMASALLLPSGQVLFKQLDMRHLHELQVTLQADVIVCQRAIHYLRFADARRVITQMKRLLAPDGRLYISASGIDSELGHGYKGAGTPLNTRYCELEPPMRNKHAIHGPVCLYSKADMAQLLTGGGLDPQTVFSSPFGNIKAVAQHV